MSLGLYLYIARDLKVSLGAPKKVLCCPPAALLSTHLMSKGSLLESVWAAARILDNKARIDYGLSPIPRGL